VNFELGLEFVGGSFLNISFFELGLFFPVFPILFILLAD
jgi:hypothetical protein